MLYYLLLYSLFLGASFGDAALAFGEMKQQMHEQGFMEALPTQLLSCLAENRTISDETCGQLDYIGRLHAMWAAAAKAGPVAKPATIELESSDYTSQFERNIAKNM